MKKIIVSILILSKMSFYSQAQCTCNYSYTSYGEQLDFVNLSVVSNAHYYWNFGDGDGSNEINPTHLFPDNGEYLITLYALDTVSNCSNYHQTWISVVKQDTLTCTFSFTDSIIDYGGFNNYGYDMYPQISNCDWLHVLCNVAGPANFCCPGFDINWGATVFLAGLNAFTSDSINSSRLYKEYYKTVPFQFSATLNYQSCSPNFEVVIDYLPNGALVKLAAMNKEGADTFWIVGFGNGIPLIGDTASYLYPYYGKDFAWIIEYAKTDTVHGCSVRGTQQILIQNPYFTWPPSCAFSLLPQNETVLEHSSVQFIVATGEGVSIHWQQDAGFGFTDLTNAGQYTGVNTDTLTISNVQLIMNNNHYRCRLQGNTGGCHNTSPDVILNVQPIGINEVDLMKIKIYPNPADEYLSFILPNNVPQVEFGIYDILGKPEISSSATSTKTLVDVSGLEKGIYVVQIKAGDYKGRQKFIKK